MQRSDRPVYVLIGTKAQYIKTAPLLRLMQAEGWRYRLIDTGQHAALTSSLRKELGIKEPDVRLHTGENIASVFGAVRWLVKLLFLVIAGRARLRSGLFMDGHGICIVHGDTASTLVSLLLAKRVGMKVAHIEAGLRSFNILKPFPEEAIRIICMRLSDYLFAPSDWAVQNLKKMKLSGEVIDIKQNTAVEALFYSLANSNECAPVDAPHCVMTVHRMETIFSKRRLSFVVEMAESIARDLPVVFVIHDATRKKLEQYDLLDRILGSGTIKTTELVGHAKFVRLLATAAMVVTDGGSVQEECSYLDIPCLVLRSETERLDGIGSNARLCKFDTDIVENFLADYRGLNGGGRVENVEPSRRILDALSEDREISRRLSSRQ